MKSRSSKRVFFSYARRDSSLRDALLKQLAPLRRTGILDIWHDQQIAPGEDWKLAIDRQIDAADIILLLVTSEFLASESCSTVEMTKAMSRWEEKRAMVVPIIACDCLWEETPLARLQVILIDDKPVTSHSDPNVAWAQVARRIRDLVGPLSKISPDRPKRRPLLLALSLLLLAVIALVAMTYVLRRPPVISCGEANPRATTTCKLTPPRPDHFEEDTQTRSLPFSEVRLDQMCPDGAAAFASFTGTCESSIRPADTYFKAVEIAGRIGGRCGRNQTGGSGSVNPQWNGTIDLPSGSWNLIVDTVFRHITKVPSCQMQVDDDPEEEIAQPPGVPDSPAGWTTRKRYNLGSGLHRIRFECNGLKDFRGCLGGEPDLTTTTSIKYRLEMQLRRND